MPTEIIIISIEMTGRNIASNKIAQMHESARRHGFRGLGSILATYARHTVDSKAILVNVSDKVYTETYPLGVSLQKDKLLPDTPASKVLETRERIYQILIPHLSVISKTLISIRYEVREATFPQEIGSIIEQRIDALKVEIRDALSDIRNEIIRIGLLPVIDLKKLERGDKVYSTDEYGSDIASTLTPFYGNPIWTVLKNDGKQITLRGNKNHYILNISSDITTQFITTQAGFELLKQYLAEAKKQILAKENFQLQSINPDESLVD